MTDFPFLLLAMAAASYACRAAGFFVMRFVPMTARLDHALKATPVAVMAGITAITAANGGPAEWVAIALVVVCMWMTRNDVAAALAGVVAVGAMRWLAG